MGRSTWGPNARLERGGQCGTMDLAKVGPMCMALIMFRLGWTEDMGYGSSGLGLDPARLEIGNGFVKQAKWVEFGVNST